jgi:hypothetical protein
MFIDRRIHKDSVIWRYKTILSRFSKEEIPAIYEIKMSLEEIIQTEICQSQKHK